MGPSCLLGTLGKNLHSHTDDSAACYAVGDELLCGIPRVLALYHCGKLTCSLLSHLNLLSYLFRLGFFPPWFPVFLVNCFSCSKIIIISLYNIFSSNLTDAITICNIKDKDCNKQYFDRSCQFAELFETGLMTYGIMYSKFLFLDFYNLGSS